MYKRFLVGVDRARMKLYNVDNAVDLSSDKEEEYDFEEMAAQQSRNTQNKFTSFIL